MTCIKGNQLLEESSITKFDASYSIMRNIQILKIFKFTALKIELNQFITRNINLLKPL